MNDFRFGTDIRVRFAETDAQGVAHNSNYLVWFEVARIAYLEEHAGGYQSLRDQGLESFVLESHIRYRLPAHFDDRLRINARVGELRGARFRFDYEITRNGEVIADGWTTHACVDARTLRPIRIPEVLAEAIRRAEESLLGEPPGLSLGEPPGLSLGEPPGLSLGEPPGLSLGEPPGSPRPPPPVR